MSETQMLRASDRDRQDVVDGLRAAVGDGRLQMDEYMARMETAYQAVTVGDLAPLCADLPAPAAERRPDALRAVSPGALRAGSPVTLAGPHCCAAGPAAFVAGLPGSIARLPAVLRATWAMWLTAVLVNVVVWVLVSGTTGHLLYPWPLWVAGPWGAILVAISAPVSQVRRGRP
jgi:hypothetical protein